MAADEGLQIAGYYAAAENFNENSIEKLPGARIADKISEQLGSAVCVMVLKSSCLIERLVLDIKLFQS